MNAKILKRIENPSNLEMDPASSSDDESSSDVSEIKNVETPQQPQSFDDLPTDDSGSEILSDTDDEDTNDEGDNDHGSIDNDILENQTMEDRLKLRQHHDIRRKKKNSNGNRIEKSQIINQIKPKKGTKNIPKSMSKKHAPKEVSSKRADYFRRGAPLPANSGIAVESTGAMNLYKSRDPRMEGLHGHFDQGAFDHNYAFLEEVSSASVDIHSIIFYKTRDLKTREKY